MVQAEDSPTVSPVRVVVLPFEVMGDVGTTRAWVGRAVQQSLVADLSRVGNVVVDASDPSTSATNTSADFVVEGSVQQIGQDLRIVGRVTDSKSGKVVSLKSTGAMRDLFSLQDTLATQARRALPMVKPTVAPPGPVAYSGPVPTTVDASTYLNSDLDRAVRLGTVNRPLSVEPTDAYRDYTYGQRGLRYPIYGGYYYGYNYPVVIIRNPSCLPTPRLRADVRFGGEHFNGYVRIGGPVYSCPSPAPATVVRGPNTVGYYPMTLQPVSR